MTVLTEGSWRAEFGIDGRLPPTFFATPSEVDAEQNSAPQPHSLRRAFEQLKVDGILCQDGSPLVYFRNVVEFRLEEVTEIHRHFWNQGVAPLLVLISANEVQVYSGLTEPAPPGDAASAKGLVERLDRVAEKLKSFVVSVESGEYFARHRTYFNPQQRVDRHLLRNLRNAREELSKSDEESRRAPEPHILDAFLCRLVFTCYLFDREIIGAQYLAELGIENAERLSDVLAISPRSDAKAKLYKLFGQLRLDFNGDLFGTDLDVEAEQIRVRHIQVVSNFFEGTDPKNGQRSFWPYEFSIIPIETISAIYEHFLKAAGEDAKKKAGAFYTPRVLADLVLDFTFRGERSLLLRTFLDPACGSGIFLVGVFNRLAEEWTRENPSATYDAKLRGLVGILRNNIFGVDKHRSACLIAAFSLYLALLDQLAPPDIRRVLRKMKVLPPLVVEDVDGEGSILCADFFSANISWGRRFDYVVGNPPWGSSATGDTPAGQWCEKQVLPVADKQLATAFMWKAPQSLVENGRVCFVLPTGTFFRHSQKAIEFQQKWLRRHSVETILNLADYQRFLFEDAELPALVVKYAAAEPKLGNHEIHYLVPKADWTVTQTDVIRVLPVDQTRVRLRDMLADLSGEDAPQVLKQRFWGTPRDRRFLARLMTLPRLRDVVRQPKDGDSKKPWLVAEGFQPVGEGDDPEKGKVLDLPSPWFVKATSSAIHVLLSPRACDQLPDSSATVRSGSNTVTSIYKAPHVLVNSGFSKVAFADFDVSFQDSIRAIHGPPGDRDMLMFLAAYLRSPLARYFQFHTSASWGIGMQVVDTIDLLRTPFVLPEHTRFPERASEIVAEVARRLIGERTALYSVGDSKRFRRSVQLFQAKVNPLFEEYFDLDDVERMLIADTIEVSIPSSRPTRKMLNVPSAAASDSPQRTAYRDVLVATLNQWAADGFAVEGEVFSDANLGVATIVVDKVRRGMARPAIDAGGVLGILKKLQDGAASQFRSFELIRGLKVFDKNRLYVTKPISRRFWTPTAALNDADEIAGSILMRSAKRGQ